MERIRPRWALAAVLVAAVSLAVQQWLEPFTAESHMGLLTNGGDLEVYRHGALQILHGTDLYADEVPGGGWFTYPPFAAMAFVPLALLSFPVAKAVWMLASFAGLVSTVWRCATVLGSRRDRALAVFSVAMAAAALDVEAVRGTLWQGQVNLLLMAAIVWDLTRRREGRYRGWSVGVAAGIKLTAIVFIGYLVVTRQWRAGATASLTAAATVGLAWLVLPADSLQYWTFAVFQTDRIGPLTHPGNYSIGGILATLWAPDAVPTAVWLACIGVAAIVGLIAARRADRTGHRLLAIAITGLLSCTVTPLAWGHHWVWTVPLLAVVIDRIARSHGATRGGWIVAAVAIYTTTFMWFNAWLYRTSQHLGAQYATYVQALDAAIDQMTRTDKLIVVASHPLLYLAVVLVTLALTRNHKWGNEVQVDRDPRRGLNHGRGDGGRAAR